MRRARLLRRRFDLRPWTPLAVGCAFALSIASASAAPTPQATISPQQTITVGGEGEASAPPDVAYVSVGVQTQAPTAAEATADNSRRMAAVLDALRARGLGPRELQTSGLSLSAQFERNRPEVVTGYQATNNLTVTVNDVERAGELLDAALAAGANRIGGLRFALRDTTALRQQALAEAARAARARAEALAAPLGLQIVGIATVAEESVVTPQPRVAMAEAVAAPPAPAPPVEAGELRITARVRIAFLFE